MKKLAALTLSLFLIYGTALADSPKDADPQPAKSAPPAKPKAEKKATESTDSKFAAELEELRQTLQAQQEQLQMLKEELAKRDRAIDEAREAAATANARAAEAASKATEAVNTSAEVKNTEASLTTTVSDLKAGSTVVATANGAGNSNGGNGNAANANVGTGTNASSSSGSSGNQSSGEESASIHYKGITITPGGFIAAESVFRTRAVSGDVNTPFNSIPYPGNSLSRESENNFSGRQSRITMLGEGKIGAVKLSGYYEADWLGAGSSSNNRQSNSYVLRQRQIWGQAKTDSGWSFTGGQMWSLATENRKGIDNRAEWIPATIDAQYNVGFTWARQYGFRVVKNFGDQLALAISAEGPQATVGGRGFSSVTTINSGAAPATLVTTGATTATTGNTFIDAPGSGGGLYNLIDGTGYSINKTPDFIVKLAADPGIGHYELFGIVSTFQNRFYPCGAVGTNAKDTAPPKVPTTVSCTVNGVTSSTVSSAGAANDSKVGGGLGASARWLLANKKFEFGLKAVGGDGIGRYGSSQLADLTFRPDGTAALIRSGHGLASLELHPSPKFDIYAYYGAEYAWRAGYVGYDSITVTKTAAIPATATTPAIPATTTTAIKTNQIGGYASPFANNTGCSTENPPINQLNPSSGGSCAGDTRVIMEGTLGFWHKLYQGPKGGLRWGIQYSYVTRNAYTGNNNVATAPGTAPKAVDNLVFTSFRYYIP
jgi:hypothetical protein